MKLITKYNRILIPALIIIFIISGISCYFLIRKTLQNELDLLLLRSKKRIENYIATNNAMPVITSFDDQNVSFEKINIPLTDTGLKSATQYIPEQKKEHISRRLIFQIKVKEELYKVTINEPLEGTKHLTMTIVRIDIATIFIILLLLALINRNVLYRIWRPFYNSLSTIKSFKVNDKLPLNFPATSITEFSLMNKHFYMAAENAVRDYKILKEFSENASHEIQTPLAIIHTKLDLLVQQENLTEIQSELIQTVYHSVNKLSTLNKSLLLLAKIDNRQFYKNSDIFLDEVLKNKVNDFQDFWQSKGIAYSVNLEQTLIQTNNELLEILLNNIFSNATRHNIENGSIDILLNNKILQISNSGPSTPLDPERLYKRFYKELPAGENNGLGLSIIKEICTVSAVEINYSYKDERHLFSLTWI